MPLHLRRGDVTTRLATLATVPAGVFAVHQLRYWLAFGGHAGAQLHAQGHAYLHSLVPWIVLALAVAAGSFLRMVGRAFGGDHSLPGYAMSFAALWLLCAVSLLALYSSQEFLEGLVAAGHPAGLAGIFGYGGWWAIPAAIAVGVVLAAVFYGARWVLREVADRRRRIGSRVRRSSPVPRLLDLRLPSLAPLAGGCSVRGPPR